MILSILEIFGVLGSKTATTKLTSKYYKKQVKTLLGKVFFVKKPLQKYFHDAILKKLQTSHQTPIVRESIQTDQRIATEPSTNQVETLRPVHTWTRSQRCDRSTHGPGRNVATCLHGSGRNVATGPHGSGCNDETGPRTDQVATLQLVHVRTRS